MSNLKHIKNFSTFSEMLKRQKEEKKLQEKSAAQREYADFFLKMLQDYDVSSPAELSDQDKKEFFNKIASTWNKNEKRQTISESFVSETNDSKILVDCFEKITRCLESEVKKVNDVDLIRAYKSDIKDYEKLVDLAKINVKKAVQEWHKLDTPIREYVNDYLAEKEKKALSQILGVDIGESVITINERNAFLTALALAKKSGKSNFEFKGKIYEIKVKDGSVSTTINEEKITNDDQFREYAKKILKKAHGDNYDDSKAEKVINGLLSSKGENGYGELVGRLQNSL